MVLDNHTWPFDCGGPFFRDMKESVFFFVWRVCVCILSHAAGNESYVLFK